MSIADDESVIPISKVIEIVNDRLIPLKGKSYPQSKYKLILEAFNDSTIGILESIIDAVKEEQLKKE